MNAFWRFEYERSSDLPARAWIASIQGNVVRCLSGSSVRCEVAGFFSGTWSGPNELASVANAATVFGSGIVRNADQLLAVTPGHVMEGIYFATWPGTTLVANSLVGLLTASRAELDPKQPYPALILPMAELRWMPSDPRSGLLKDCCIDLPTRSLPVNILVFENLRIDAGGSARVVPKPRETEFESFTEYRDRISAACASLLANAAGYEPVVSLSGGYDSTAVAVIASRLGCRRAVSMRTARLFPSGDEAPDDGSAVARALGLDIESFEREAYRSRRDFPEAEFLATGMTGEDVPLSAYERSVRRRLLLTGYWAGTLWPRSRNYPPPNHPGDFSGSGLTEYELRADFIHVPLATFGATAADASGNICCSIEMEPYMVGGHYDRPIPRRIAEDAGVPRSMFALRKRAASVMLQRDPERWFAPATLDAIRAFADAEGTPLRVRRRNKSRMRRAVIRLLRMAQADGLAEPLDERRRALVHFEPELGTTALRWAVEVIRPRYAAAESLIARRPAS